MGKTLYLECKTGISGDMMVAALLDLGANQEKLYTMLDSLQVDGYKIAIERVKKAGLDVCDFDVQLDVEHENHDHDMEYLYGHLNNGDHHHEHHHHEHHHDHHHNETHAHHHHHEHRGLKEIEAIIEQANMTENAKVIAKRIFEIIAEAEAKAHGESIEKVHFHEVGAIDSIVDICSVAICIDDLEITDVIVPYLTEGTGSVRCQHGILPVPVPAVVNIVQQNGLRLRITDTVGEMVTPTGAAIVAAIKTREQLPKEFKIDKIGMGAGKRTYEIPSILRALLIQPTEN